MNVQRRKMICLLLLWTWSHHLDVEVFRASLL